MRKRDLAGWVAALFLTAIAGVVSYSAVRSGTSANQRQQTIGYALTGGQASRGRDLIVAYGCGACHQIPGISLARGQVGPPLQGLSARAVIAGSYANVPATIIRWIENPRAMKFDTAMPNLNLSEAQARDVAAYLYQQK
jgi:cytochrome c2